MAAAVRPGPRAGAVRLVVVASAAFALTLAVPAITLLWWVFAVAVAVVTPAVLLVMARR